MALLAASSFPAASTAFSSVRSISRTTTCRSTPCTGRAAAGRLSLQTNDEDGTSGGNDVLRNVLSTAAAASLGLALSAAPLSSQPAFAYEESDYASETVTNVVSQLKSTAGDVDRTFSTLEEVAKIITEGKGVGGTLTYGAYSNDHHIVVINSHSTSVSLVPSDSFRRH